MPHDQRDPAVQHFGRRHRVGAVEERGLPRVVRAQQVACGLVVLLDVGDAVPDVEGAARQAEEADAVHGAVHREHGQQEELADRRQAEGESRNGVERAGDVNDSDRALRLPVGRALVVAGEERANCGPRPAATMSRSNSRACPSRSSGVTRPIRVSPPRRSNSAIQSETLTRWSTDRAGRSRAARQAMAGCAPSPAAAKSTSPMGGASQKLMPSSRSRRRAGSKTHWLETSRPRRTSSAARSAKTVTSPTLLAQPDGEDEPRLPRADDPDPPHGRPSPEKPFAANVLVFPKPATPVVAAARVGR